MNEKMYTRMKFIAKHVHTDENPYFILLYGSLLCIRCMLSVVYKEIYVSATQDNSFVVIRNQLLITLCQRALYSAHGSGKLCVTLKRTW